MKKFLTFITGTLFKFIYLQKIKKLRKPCNINYDFQCDFETSDMKNCKNKLMNKLRGQKKKKLIKIKQSKQQSSHNIYMCFEL